MPAVYDFEAEERKRKQISLVATSVIMLLLFLLTYFLVIVHGQVPNPEENQWIAAGRIDFGDMTEGSKDINNFFEASETPSENAPSSTAQDDPTPSNNTEPIISSSEPSEVSAPPAEEKPKKKKVKVKRTAETLNDETSGGSNHGNNSSGTGNRGTPNSPVLDPEGLYAWGTGEGDGLNGRVPLALPQPKYEVDEEAKITFEIVISPDGRVKSVTAKTIGTSPELKKAGMDAIKKWRFNAIESGKIQKTRVTIRFKLK
ncbi:MAG: energy transducer TonB [Bacteroidia bacterium]|nr:energy transducer TonB [Bacteroidia bacterium]